MKKRLLSILLMCCMVLTLLPTAAFAEESTETPPVCTCETACTVDNMNKECPVCGAENAIPQSCGQYVPVEDGTGENGSTEGADDPDGATKLNAADQVQAMINALPSAEEITEENAEEVEAQLDAIDEAAKKLSDEELDELDLSRYNKVATVLADMAVIPTAVFAEAAPTGTALTQEDISSYKQKKDSTYSENGIYLPAGSYYLAEDIYLVGDDADPNSAWPLLISGSDVTLDLNGHVLDLKKQNINIYSNGNLTLTDSNQNAEHKFRVEDSGLWVWDETQGTETVAGGVITGGAGVNGGNGTIGIHGGGVNVSGGSLTMNGGSIVGCTANSGGGVRVSNGSFIMKGGRIAGCTAVKEGNSYGSGGGVRVDEDGSFTMAGGSIEGCTAADAGGGVNVAYGSFTMKGGSIVGCTAAYAGGGVDAGGDSFTMKSGASISGCTAAAGGGVSLSNNSFTMAGGSITGCTANNGGGIYVQPSSLAKLTMSDGSITDCTAAYAGGGVFVCRDYQSGSFTMNGGSITNCTAGGAANAVHADGDFTDKTGTIDRKLVSGIKAGHTGTVDDPILIATTEGLKDFRDKVNGGQTDLCAKLTADIVLNDGTFDENGTYTGADGNPVSYWEKWTPIGTGSDPYTGTFDGGGHTIKGLYVDVMGIAGLFGEIGGATIWDVTVDGYVKGTSVAGGIVGTASNSTTSIQNCVNRCYVVATNNSSGSGSGNAGGIVGAFSDASISGCANTGAVNGTNYVGGIAGYPTRGSISSCYNTGAVSGTNYVGGIAGYPTRGSISSCYNTGAVSGADQVGGVVGRATGGSISNCYNTGAVKGTNWGGGIAGYVSASTVSRCYNTGAVSGADQVGGVVGLATADYSGANASITSCCYLTGTAENGVGYNEAGTVTDVDARSKTEFADGTVLALLKGDRTDSPWTKTDYLKAAGMTLPLLDWQTADEHTHDYQWKYDDTEHWKECSCGFIEQGSKAAHEEVKGICTDGIKCECGYEMHMATGGHSYPTNWSPVRPGSTHSKACTNPGCGVTKTESCTGGTATCTEQATCEVCGEKYGTTNPNNHSYEWQSENGQYWQKCKLCDFETDKKLVPTITIIGSDKVCRTQDYTFSFTLPEGATDAGCGYGFSLMGGDVSLTVENGVYTGVVKAEWYDENENSFVLTVYAKTADSFEFSAEKAVAIQNEHSGGTATCTEQATCEVCGEKYGDLKPHSYSPGWSVNDTDHWHECTTCGAKTDEAEHTDTNKDHKCDVCEKVLSECADTNKDHKCDLCDKVLSEHTGGTATCTEKAKCEACGESYGELDSNNHADMKHIEAKAATKTAEGNTEYWYCDGCGKYFADKDGAKEITKADTVTAKLPDEKPTSPKTGDTSNLALWIALLFISGGVITVTTVVSKKKRHS